jgi:hypothetical protein
MLVCGKCGKEDTEFGDFCAFCGEYLERVSSTGICPKCTAADSEGGEYCSKCGAVIRVACPSCHEYHHIGCIYCPYGGVNIAEYQAKLDREKAAKAEFEQVFPEKFRKLCWAAHIRAFLINLAIWEVVVLLIIMYVFMGRSQYTGVLGIPPMAVAIVMFIVAVITYLVTGEAFDNKRDKLRKAYIEEKSGG